MEYTLSWQNKGGVVESGMTKWILALYNNSNTLIKKVEDTNSQYLQNFTTVTLKMPLSSDEAKRQSSTGNKMIVYYDRISDATKLSESTVSFDVSNLSINIEDIEQTSVTMDSLTDVDDSFLCISNDPIGDGKTNIYKYVGNDEYKWISDTGSRDKIISDCSKYTYTGKQIKAISNSGQCGPDYGICPHAQCCSKYGWCAGTQGQESVWCSEERNLSDVVQTFSGHKSQYDGKNIGDIEIFKGNTTFSDVSNNGRCGSQGNNKKCPGNQCCSMWGWCGGSKPAMSIFYCDVVTLKWNGRTYSLTYKGSQSDYDGTGEYWKPGTVKGTKKKIKDMPEVVLKCKKNDPLSKNLGTTYKWDEPSKSIKKINSLPAGAIQYDIDDCDGVKYGGLA